MSRSSLLALGLVATGSLVTVVSAGPCDIYATGGTPCVAAHSTTRALYASYNGPLYRVRRQSDGKKLDIGMAKPVDSPNTDAGGYADATAQDAFCANSICVIELIYDQSGKGNHLYQAGPGTFRGPAKGAFDTQPIADMAPVTIGGHKAYGVFIMPGMGFRNNNATDIAINDEPEGIYYVVDGKHYDSGCCFDYGNSSTNGRAVGTGTMETTYFGTSTVWGSGSGAGPWIMSDMEAGLFSGHSAKQNIADPTIGSWRFVTAVVDGGGSNRWDLRGGNAQQGGLKTFYSGARPGDPDDRRYYPMRRQGGILLGTGGDNGNGSSGTFYEGVMTTGYPTEATTDAVQSNIVAAKYDVPRVVLSRLTTFTPGSTQQITETFTNVSATPAVGVRLSIAGLNSRWTSTVESGTAAADSIAQGASVSATFKVTSPMLLGSGFLTGKVSWKDSPTGTMKSEAIVARARNVLPVKINEVRFGSAANPTDQFIELYNASDRTVDISNWSLIATAGQWSPTQLATIPAASKLAAHSFYLLGLAGNGLASPAGAGATAILVRSTAGLETGRTITIDGESRTIKSVGSAASPLTTIFIPVSTDPFLTLPAGSTHLPVAGTAGFEIGQKIGIDLGGNYEVATVTAIGKPGTQTTLTSAASAGGTSIKLAAATNVATGDSLTIGTGAHKEVVKVTGVDASAIALASPLRFGHASGIDVSNLGSGIAFTPATRFRHHAGDALQALGSGITLDRPLTRTHAYGAPALGPLAITSGYQGTPAPNQWFGTPLSASSGSIALQEDSTIVDAIVYTSQQSNSSGNGTIPSPELATLVSDQGKGGCIVPAGLSL